MFQRVIM